MSLSMFQLMVETYGIRLDLINEDRCVESPYIKEMLGTVTGNPGGLLHESLPISTLRENEIDITNIGSINAKFLLNNGNKLSVLIFNNGKIKISGGFCKNIDPKLYIESIVKSICLWCYTIDKGYKISCLNGQIYCGKFNGLSQLKRYLIGKQFAKIYDPKPNQCGRRDALKIKFFDHQSGTGTIGIKGTMQIFGIKSFDHFSYLQNLLKD